MTLRGSKNAKLIQPNLRPHQLGIAQIIAFSTHIERYNDVGIIIIIIKIYSAQIP